MKAAAAMKAAATAMMTAPTVASPAMTSATVSSAAMSSAPASQCICRGQCHQGRHQGDQAPFSDFHDSNPRLKNSLKLSP
jgi:hypothetical protein